MLFARGPWIVHPMKPTLTDRILALRTVPLLLTVALSNTALAAILFFAMAHHTTRPLVINR